MISELNKIIKYLDGEIIRVRAAEQNNFSNLFSNGDEHLYATAYNVVVNLLSFNKNLQLEIDSRFNHQLIKSTIENIFLLRIFSENLLSSKHEELFKLHFRVVNFNYLSKKYEIAESNKLISELKSECNESLRKFANYYPKLSRDEVITIFSKRYGWLYSSVYNGKEAKLNDLLAEFGNQYEINIFKYSSIYAHSNFFISSVEYANELTEYCIDIIKDTLDVDNIGITCNDVNYSKIDVPKDEIGDLQSDKILNYTHTYKLKFKQLIELAATKIYLEMHPDRINAYIITSFLKISKNKDKVLYRDILNKAYIEYVRTSDMQISIEEFSKKCAGMLFGFTLKNNGHVDDYNTFIKKQIQYLNEKGLLTSKYESILEEVNLLDHPSMYSYLNIEQGDIKEYLNLEKELKDYLYE